MEKLEWHGKRFDDLELLDAVTMLATRRDAVARCKGRALGVMAIVPGALISSNNRGIHSMGSTRNSRPLPARTEPSPSQGRRPQPPRPDSNHNACDSICGGASRSGDIRDGTCHSAYNDVDSNSGPVRSVLVALQPASSPRS